MTTKIPQLIRIAPEHNSITTFVQTIDERPSDESLFRWALMSAHRTRSPKLKCDKQCRFGESREVLLAQHHHSITLHNVYERALKDVLIHDKLLRVFELRVCGAERMGDNLIQDKVMRCGVHTIWDSWEVWQAMQESLVAFGVPDFRYIKILNTPTTWGVERINGWSRESTDQWIVVCDSQRAFDQQAAVTGAMFDMSRRWWHDVVNGTSIVSINGDIRERITNVWWLTVQLQGVR